MRCAAPGPAASIHLADSQTLWRIVIKPDLAIGEAYMQDKLRIDDDDLGAFIHLLMANSKHWESHWAGRLSLFSSDRFATLAHLTLPRASKLNVAHHYDLTDALFASFLDPTANIPAAILRKSIHRLTRHRLSRWRGSPQSQTCSQVKDYWTPAAAAAV